MPRLLPLTLIAGLCVTSGAASEPAQADVEHWLSCRNLQLVTTLNTALAPLPKWEPKQQRRSEVAVVPMTIRVSSSPMPRLKTTPNF